MMSGNCFDSLRAPSSDDDNDDASTVVSSDHGAITEDYDEDVAEKLFEGTYQSDADCNGKSARIQKQRSNNLPMKSTAGRWADLADSDEEQIMEITTQPELEASSQEEEFSSANAFCSMLSDVKGGKLECIKAALEAKAVADQGVADKACLRSWADMEDSGDEGCWQSDAPRITSVIDSSYTIEGRIGCTPNNATTSLSPKGFSGKQGKAFKNNAGKGGEASKADQRRSLKGFSGKSGEAFKNDAGKGGVKDYSKSQSNAGLCRDSSAKGKGKGSNRKLQCQFAIGIEEEKSFQVVRRIIGPGGENMKQIAKQSGAKLRLRGRGSRFLEGPNQKESTDELMLCLSSQDEVGFAEAKELVTDLLRGIYDSYRAFCRRNQMKVPDLDICINDGYRAGSR